MSAREQVEVFLDADLVPEAAHVGTLYFQGGRGDGVFSFAYTPAWLKRPDAFQIDPELTLHSGEAYPAGNIGLFRIFLDSAPDRWGRLLLDRREVQQAREAGRRARALGESDYLLGVHDECRMGALRFCRDPSAPFLDNDPHRAAPPKASLRDLEAASLALEDPKLAGSAKYSQWLAALVAPGSSLGGARPKANFTDTDGRLWIAKFPSTEDRRDMGAWEMLVHRLGAEAGLNLPDAQLLSLTRRYRTFATRRFDRTATRRRFFVSAMTLLGRADGQGGSYLDLAEFLSRHGSARYRDGDLQELYTRVTFNVLVSNTDDHLRNHGFILESDGWRLAPAYDVNANPAKATHTLAIDDSDPTPDLALVRSTAKYYGLNAARAQRVEKKLTAVVANWRSEASKLKIPRQECELMKESFHVG